MDNIGAELGEIERRFPGAFYVFGRGRTVPDEPLYGCRILVDKGETVLGEGESDDPREAIRNAIDDAARAAFRSTTSGRG